RRFPVPPARELAELMPPAADSDADRRAIAPRISVVVSTRDRPDRVRSLISTLTEQDLGSDEFEVVLVDNGSAVPLELERLLPGPVARPLRLRVIRNPRP